MRDRNERDDRNRKRDRGKGRGKGRGRRDDKRDGGGVVHRVLEQLSHLEKGLTKKDFALQQKPLEAIYSALRPAGFQKFEDLDFNLRGRLLTTLMRVTRQAPPPAKADDEAPKGEQAETETATASQDGANEASPEEALTQEEQAKEASPAESAPEPGDVATQTTDAQTAEAQGTGAQDVDTQDFDTSGGVASGEDVPETSISETPTSETAETKPSDGAEAAAQEAQPTSTPEETSAQVNAETQSATPEGSEDAAAATEKEKAVEPPPLEFADILAWVGRVWHAAGDSERGNNAISMSGRRVDIEPPLKRRERSEKSERTDKRKNEKRDRTARDSNSWRAEVKALEEQGNTKQAARIYEKRRMFQEASKLFEGAGDMRGALRAAARGRDDARVRMLADKMELKEIRRILERANKWDLLMEKTVAAGDFVGVARLYERANQFDQAALAWEKAGKLSMARKAFLRVKDLVGATRVRELEVSRMVERGDRMGASVLLVAAGERDRAVETLKELGGVKAYRFMKKLSLDEAADAFAKQELVKAQQGTDAIEEARWQEALGEHLAAAELFEKAERSGQASRAFEQAGEFAKAAKCAEDAAKLDRAESLYKRAGDSANAERVSKLPRPEPRSATQDSEPEAEPSGMTPSADGAEVVAASDQASSGITEPRV